MVSRKMTHLSLKAHQKEHSFPFVFLFFSLAPTFVTHALASAFSSLFGFLSFFFFFFLAFCLFLLLLFASCRVAHLEVAFPFVSSALVALPRFRFLALLCFALSKQPKNQALSTHTHTHTRERATGLLCVALLVICSHGACKPASHSFLFLCFYSFSSSPFPLSLPLSPCHSLSCLLACQVFVFLFLFLFLFFLALSFFFSFFCSPHIHRQHPSSWAAASNSKHTQSTRQTMRHTT